MELQLKNIGMIKEANVRLDGLTVIAGENDTGKSTVAKNFHYEINSLDGFGIFPIPFKRAKLHLKDEDREDIFNATFIDSPTALDTFSFIKNSMLLIHQHRLNIHIPYYKSDLILKLSQDERYNYNSKNSYDNISLYEKIKNLINGEIIYDKSKDDIFFKKSSLKDSFNMENTSNGIKMFGFLQILILNGTLKRNSVLILDEPEVHLHPKWQLEYAKILVELVKNGVKILVTSHSPYMIEALKRYSELEEIEDKTNFYLAEDGYIKYQDNLENIFEKLVLPIRELKKLKLERYING